MASHDNFSLWLSDELIKFSDQVDLDVYLSYISAILENEDEEEEKEKEKEIFDLIEQLKPDKQEVVKLFCKNIMDKWNEVINFKDLKSMKPADNEFMSLEVQMHNILTKQLEESHNKYELAHPSFHTKSANPNNLLDHQSTSQDLKKNILNNYSHLSSEEESDQEITEEQLQNKQHQQPNKHYQSIKQHKQQDINNKRDEEDNDSKNHHINLYQQKHQIKQNSEQLLVKNTNSQNVEERERVKREKMKEDSENKKKKDKEEKEKQKEKANQRKEAEKKRTQKGERRR